MGLGKQPVDIAGKRYGSLVAMHYVGKQEWVFQCDCGLTRQARRYRVEREVNPACRQCQPARKERINLTGQVFDCVTILRREFPMSQTWVCRCQCGAIVIKNLSSRNRERGVGCSVCRPSSRDVMLQRSLRPGDTFGCLTVVGVSRRENNTVWWRCDCACGGSREATAGKLRSTKNPGCSLCERERRAAVHVTHGGALGGRSKLYGIWKSMLYRCTKDVPRNINYAGKGIKVCEEWLDFSVFRAWALSVGYQPGLSIDRIDPDDNYRPGNCEWVTREENSRRVWNPKILQIRAALSAETLP